MLAMYDQQRAAPGNFKFYVYSRAECVIGHPWTRWSWVVYP